jgi:hypothetical protein
MYGFAGFATKQEVVRQETGTLNADIYIYIYMRDGFT